uniref:Peptidase C1A papain C-terminal domain-containing protein n=1 Tax=Timema douglasi TaxID=61478 RepID=A0A7R8VFG3_TIMDO|nr:unnamed protein product [Timema douglasi]
MVSISSLVSDFSVLTVLRRISLSTALARKREVRLKQKKEGEKKNDSKLLEDGISYDSNVKRLKGPQLDGETRMANVTACLLAATFNTYVLPYLVHIHSHHLKWEDFKTKEEVHSKYCGYKRGDLDSLEIKKVNYTLRSTNELPTNFDWRDYGYVTPVRDQGDCGACWAFSAMSVLESHILKKNRPVKHLSEQWLIDCSDMNCSGGWMGSAYDFMKQKGAIVEDELYQYTAAEDETCRNFSNNVNTTIKGVCMIEPYNETMLMHAVYTEGPICVALNGSPDDFHHYSEDLHTYKLLPDFIPAWWYDGLARSVACLSTELKVLVLNPGMAKQLSINLGVYTNYKVCDPNTLTHAATLCGFGTENGLDYWLLKNSWGTDWGEDGYVKMMRKNNTCGVTTAGCYPMIG